MSQEKYPNRVRFLATQKGMNQQDLVRLLDWNASKVSRAWNEQQDLKGAEITALVRVLGVDFNAYFRQDEGDVGTGIGSFQHPSSTERRRRYQHWLVAENEESCHWLQRGISDWRAKEEQGLLVETPGRVKIKLEPGRVLLGRAVEDGKFREVPFTQHLSIVRQDDQHYEKDRRISRFHCDLTVSTYSPKVMLFARSIGLYAKGRNLEEGESVTLERRDRIIFPNQASLLLEREDIS